MVKTSLKYRFAYYKEGGKERYLSSRHIQYADGCIEAQRLSSSCGLYRSDFKVPLKVVPSKTGTKRNYFSEIALSMEPTLSRAERSLLHEQRVDKVLERLNKYSPSSINIKTNFWINNLSRPLPKQILKVENVSALYRPEFIRCCTSGVNVRADIGCMAEKQFSGLGIKNIYRQSSHLMCAAPFHPFDLEVVHHHLPDKKQFLSTLRDSQEGCGLVLFDFIVPDKRNYFLEVEDNGDIRVIYYIQAGKFYKNCTSLCEYRDENAYELFCYELKNIVGLKVAELV